MNKPICITFGCVLCITSLTGSLFGSDLHNKHNTSYELRRIQARNSITGRVFGSSRQPLADVFVELLDDLDATISRTRTNGSGLYVFRGLPAGRYTVKVLPYGTDYDEQLQTVSIDNFISNTSVGRVISGTQDLQADFYLKVKRNINAGPLAAPEVIFAQDVPKEAKKFYEDGITGLREKNEKQGFENLKRAIEIYPDYYFALDRLGTEYVVRGYYEAAYILLTKATEVNKSSFSSTFGLGIASYHLKQNDKAIDLFQRANMLYKKSPDTYLWLGKALKQNSKLTEAETAYKKADEISKGKNAEVHWQLALLYNQQNRYKEAADSLELFLKFSPDARDSDKIKQLISQLRRKASKS